MAHKNNCIVHFSYYNDSDWHQGSDDNKEQSEQEVQENEGEHKDEDGDSDFEEPMAKTYSRESGLEIIFAQMTYCCILLLWLKWLTFGINVWQKEDDGWAIHIPSHESTVEEKEVVCSWTVRFVFVL